ncbi:prepilin peptidase [bacterium]|nr:prepilin peptidase [bacterium]
MLISRFVTLFLIPLGFLFSYLHFLPISLVDSIAGMALGYGSLFLASKLFYWMTGKEGIGQGDLELLAFIGSFLGLAGCWITLFLGAIIGSIIGVTYITISGKSKELQIPFGPFLALGAILYVLFQEKLILLLFKI